MTCMHQRRCYICVYADMDRDINRGIDIDIDLDVDIDIEIEIWKEILTGRGWRA